MKQGEIAYERIRAARQDSDERDRAFNRVSLSSFAILGRGKTFLSETPDPANSRCACARISIDRGTRCRAYFKRW